MYVRTYHDACHDTKQCLTLLGTYVHTVYITTHYIR
jgi:hypothetical protein